MAWRRFLIIIIRLHGSVGCVLEIRGWGSGLSKIQPDDRGSDVEKKKRKRKWRGGQRRVEEGSNRMVGEDVGVEVDE